MGQAGTDAPGTDPIAETEERALSRLAANRARSYYDAAEDEQDRDDYYTGVDWDAAPADVTAALHRLLEATHVRPLDYAPSEQLYPWVDLHPDGHLYNVYSGNRVDPEKVILADARIARERTERIAAAIRLRPTMSAGEVQAVAHAVESELHFNCEHVVPQSWFDRGEPMRGDLHHLFACEPKCNSKRGNIPYADLMDSKPVVTECGRVRGDASGFEPLTGKGAVARATLYFLVRYPGSVDERAAQQLQDALPTLLAWHASEPPGEYERHRNFAIREAQGDRNPLVDFPELVGRVDFTGGWTGLPR